ncbi:MAG: hypothetical protein OXF65_00645 [Acidimicrobiaceae bacterium]|nr:hypothetical protein [Acidimicrobiaceae bacterium]
MDTLTLARYEAQGNDFLIALLTESELLDFDASLGIRHFTRSEVARAVCDRHIGIGARPGYVHSKGADGFILGVRKPADDERVECVRMHLLNADGSFAETSGNGLACLALACFDSGIVPAGLVPFETDAGMQHCTIGADEIGSKDRPASTGRFIRVAMRKVDHGPEIPPELEQRIGRTFGGNLRHVGTGDVGNPHLVVALAGPPIGGDASELGTRAVELGDCIARLGSAYEAYFADGINVEFIWPHALNPAQPEQAWSLMMSVWERGAGLTVSCGSGSVVAATLAYRWEFVRSPNDPPHLAAEQDEANPPSSYPVDMRTAPFPGANGPGFQYWVRTVPTPHEDFFPPQLGVPAERIEADIRLRLDHLPALLDDLAAMTEPKR